MGGLSFFLALLAFTVLALSNLAALPQVLRLGTSQDWRMLLAGGALGLAIKIFLIRGRIAVFIHEYKHFVVASVVGNKIKALALNDDNSGHVQYSYTKANAHYNAMIALAPYWLPLFTAPAALTMLFPFGASPLGLVLIATCYTVDTLTGLEDIHPRQSDINLIRGGFVVGLSYLIACHVTVGTFVLAWILGKGDGLKLLFFTLWQAVEAVVLDFNR